MGKCEYYKVCKIYSEKSSCCNEPGSYYPNNYAGCHRDIDKNKENSKYIDRQKWEDKERKTKIVKLACLWFFILLIILLGQSIPGDNLGDSISKFPGIIHFLEFLVFTFVTVALSLEIFASYEFLGSFIILTTTAALSELIQLIVPGRFCSWQDFGIDMMGITAAYILLFILGALMMKTIVEFAKGI